MLLHLFQHLFQVSIYKAAFLLQSKEATWPIMLVGGGGGRQRAKLTMDIKKGKGKAVPLQVWRVPGS